ncbi:MAG: cytochrome c biogenesis protein CcsA [Bacteroidales bacterium]|nr:cytochrome c biogenesis protein CcsA [Bacteroidales bacterium]MDE7072452.1 cytochrome c biogenesis protein CcsA [Bacteroidales bacterium]
MNWNHFIGFALAGIFFQIAASILAFLNKRKPALWMEACGLAVLGVFIAGFWITAQRPPLASMGETRLWYAFFLGLCGLGVYAAYRYRWILGLGTLLSTVFLLLNLFRPELQTRPLMPILQSGWFIPHVIVYIFAYGLLSVSFLLSLYSLFRPRHTANTQLMAHIDQLTRLGAGFILTGICLGAIWAKQAWGYFWTWDPKETWALITLLCYGIYIGMRQCNAVQAIFRDRSCAFVQMLGFIALQISWYGINYLKAAQGMSVHTYA